MKRWLVACTSLFTGILTVNAQGTKNYTVQFNVAVNNQPPSVTLYWQADSTALQYTVSRKPDGSANWQTLVNNLPGTSTQYVDTNVLIGDAFEYRLTKSTLTTTGTSYVYSGIECPATEYNGNLIFIVDSTYATSLSAELLQYENDLANEGWKVIRHNVSPQDSVMHIKNLITAGYYSDTANTKVVFLFGHVPVPYSGSLNPDGHANHSGAWPADVYYGDVDGVWTDIMINNTSASRIQNHNVPGDGKFDQTLTPSNVELQVGRVDFYDLPLFAQTEEDLLRNYLIKNHRYRVKDLTVRPRALVDDNFGTFGGEAFGSNGWRLCANVSSDSIGALDFFTSLSAESYQWAYGCGGGSYTSCSGVGNTTDFTTDSVQGIFTMLFGSYFGDWDSQNNFMRSSLASGTTLTCSWAGRPHWHYHHMGLGRNIGYSARLTQNNSGVYVYNYGARFIHIALMGDPTLRMHIVAPPKDFIVVAPNLNQVNMAWTASADSVLGYYVYRLDTNGTYKRLTSSILNATNYVDSNPLIYNNKYMVRAVKLQQSASGTYYNLSAGITDSVLIANGNDEWSSGILNARVFPNPTHGNFTVQYYTTTNGQSSMEVYNMQGQLIQSMNHNAAAGINSLPFSLSTNASGIYFVKITTNIASKFIKVVVE